MSDVAEQQSLPSPPCRKLGDVLWAATAAKRHAVASITRVISVKHAANAALAAKLATRTGFPVLRHGTLWNIGNGDIGRDCIRVQCWDSEDGISFADRMVSISLCLNSSWSTAARRRACDGLDVHQVERVALLCTLLNGVVHCTAIIPSHTVHGSLFLTVPYVILYPSECGPAVAVQSSPKWQHKMPHMRSRRTLRLVVSGSVLPNMASISRGDPAYLS